MLDLSDMTMIKTSQSYFGGAVTSTLTLGDVYKVIAKAGGGEQDTVLQLLRTYARGKPDSTPIAEILSGAAGLILGPLLAKYFKLGVVSQIVAAAIGFSGGRALHSKFTKPKPRYKGYVSMSA